MFHLKEQKLQMYQKSILGRPSSLPLFLHTQHPSVTPSSATGHQLQSSLPPTPCPYLLWNPFLISLLHLVAFSQFPTPAVTATNPEVSLAREVGRLTTDLYLSLYSSKSTSFHPHQSHPSYVAEHVLWFSLLSDSIPNKSERSSPSTFLPPSISSHYLSLQHQQAFPVSPSAKQARETEETENKKNKTPTQQRRIQNQHLDL